METATIFTRFNALPDNLKKQVADFIEFLSEKKQKDSGHKTSKSPTFGSAKGMFEMAPDFDEPLEDFKEYMV